ncbi:hypothetical protein [Nocardioides sp. SYSU D00065]|uniref:hypothetical protein n=1 Tax=Nocardioides sp. SYSU D00065 TaxID=2817378 RepID=UPI001B31E1A8|nr:hypothetical protein [Nocardioides sp. SYSU D00065]
MPAAALPHPGGRAGRVRPSGVLASLDRLDPGAAVPGPYYGVTDGFEEVLAMVERTSDATLRVAVDTSKARVEDRG